jgi:hypothetical protein
MCASAQSKTPDGIIVVLITYRLGNLAETAISAEEKTKRQASGPKPCLWKESS